MKILKKLKKMDERVPNPPQLPTQKEVKNVEEKLNIKFPPSYVKYQLEYSDVVVGFFEPYHLFEDGSYLDMIKGVKEARKIGLPEKFIPFLEDNGDYYCFDLNSNGPEYKVKFWSHDGSTDEQWEDFLDWVENCWIEESE